MKALADKLGRLLPEIESRSNVYLFALFERDDAPGKWDVVLSSEWSNANAASAIRTISERLVPQLDPNELAAISRIVIIPSNEPSVSMLASGMTVQGGCAELVDCNFMGLPIRHAFVFKAQRPPMAEPTTAR